MPKPERMLTKNFAYDEMKCPCCGAATMNPEFLIKLQNLRDEFNEPMPVSSGFRCERYNTISGGAKESFHKKGRAVDVVIFDSQKRFDLVRLAIKNGIKGIEICDGHIHLDDRAQGVILWGKSK